MMKRAGTALAVIIGVVLIATSIMLLVLYYAGGPNG